MKPKLETAGSYLNSTSSINSTRKAPKLRNASHYTHMLLVIQRCLPKRGLLFESKEQLFTSFKNKLISEKQLFYKNSLTFKNVISREAHFELLFICRNI